ncbi:MAG: dTDP-glucose 4,6-dehydratase [Gammaproteobacteria bacterium]
MTNTTSRTLLVTGGAGFIGGNFARYWMNRRPQDRLINLDVLTYAGNLESVKDLASRDGYRFVRGDICDGELLRQLFDEEDIDMVVHFAAESHVDRSILGPQAFVQTNVQGTFSLREAARAAWAGDEAQSSSRFLHVSTDEVYGSLEPDEAPFTETTPYRPNSPYAASKASSDHLVRAYGHTYGLPVLVTNCSNNYGPYQFPEKLIPLTIANALQSRPIPVYGDGANVRDWLHVEDHCAGIALVLEHGAIGRTYNIGGRNERRNIDVVTRICACVDALGSASSPRADLITFVADRKGHDRRYAIDASRLEGELGWRAAYDFDSGIEATVQWYLDNRQWWERVLTGDYREYYELQYGAPLV